MFVISKRNFRVRRADGSFFVVRKDYIGDIPDDVFNSSLIQGAMKTGLIVSPESSADKALYRADHEAEKKQAEADIRPDAKKSKNKEAAACGHMIISIQ